METQEKIQIKISLVDQSTSSKLNEWEFIETDLNEQSILQDQDNQLTILQQYKFVIGISKPLETRIGLNSIQKNKITIKGRLGIKTLLS
ncbi:unnamed protein product [Paramecium pentaurelia]|uniref:Uncharacterized protein n=1 Tax=Paramecium pentaurelia TaxID=43138 RepID=A0A8S1WZW0_9CILI|nr:unnamed protein product [Paramecium pentaurelia]